jgi:hypothetical protein
MREMKPPRLVLTKDLEERNVQYMTLSHRWGPVELMSSTTSENLEKRFSAIVSLPHTFYQATLVSMKLKVSYLWIDSLCIIQDDTDDKEREIAMMADIYSNSFLNIVASTASNPTEGCYKPETLEKVGGYLLQMPEQDGGLPRRVLLYRAGREYEELLAGEESGTLDQRGWLAQERHLPGRAVILTPRHLIWECRTVKAVRDYPSQDFIFGSPSEANPSEVFPKPFITPSQTMALGKLSTKRSTTPG